MAANGKIITAFAKTTKLMSFPFYARRNLRDKQNSGMPAKTSCLYVSCTVVTKD